jgi:outer membrane protein assembly factor BamB
MVYFQATDAAIHAVDAATGQEIWRFLGSALVGLGTPAIARGVLYEGNGQSLYALDARTGELVWSYETGGLIEASAALSKNTVFVASEDQYLYAINATTGALRWSVSLGPPSFWQDQATAVPMGSSMPAPKERFRPSTPSQEPFAGRPQAPLTVVTRSSPTGSCT